VCFLERLALVARLKPDAFQRAQELASADPPAAQVVETQLRGSIFLSSNEVVFMIEGDDVELHTREWFDDPVLSTAISSWLPLFDGPLHAAREFAVWNWQSG
jgi:hypothetical protein